MNIQELDIMNAIKQFTFVNQRILAEQSGYSLGKVNQSLKTLQNDGYLDHQMRLTDLADIKFHENKPRNAIILAAGFGMRMIPIHMEIPKGLIQINDQALIERMIEQLHEVGITDITVVVGFMKEAYEYLIDKYAVKLTVNREYAARNNLHSLALVADHIHNTYIIPCDIWCGSNPFNHHELYSWYMVCDIVEDESNVRVNRKLELVETDNGGNQMIGISYIASDKADLLKSRLRALDGDKKAYDRFWEEALLVQGKMMVAARVVSSRNTFEINTYEQLRELDSSSRQLKSVAIEKIAGIMNVEQDEVQDITVIKKGMTNRSFLFTCLGKQYMMRIPGEGTDRLIDRRQEYHVYQSIKNQHIGDDIQFIDPDNGYKITTYWEGARTCDPENEEDVRLCMNRLRTFHDMALKVEHTFDIFEQIQFYESLWNGEASCFRDYAETKQKVFDLRPYIDAQPKRWVLTHIDAVPDNFLFVSEGEKTEIRLIDWEYAGMQDPHVDIAMFAIYSLYDREQVERLIDAYFTEGCPTAVRRKIYCYIAACGLLWSNWCEYKRLLGVEFGEYSIRQYRYAKEYSKLFRELQEKESAESV